MTPKVFLEIRKRAFQFLAIFRDVLFVLLLILVVIDLYTHHNCVNKIINHVKLLSHLPLSTLVSW